MFQTTEEETINEVKPIRSSERKSVSEVLPNMNYGHENYDGMNILFLHSYVGYKNDIPIISILPPVGWGKKKNKPTVSLRVVRGD